MVGPPSTAFGLLPVHVYAALSSLFDSKCRLPPVTTPVLHRCLRSFPFPQALSIGYPCLWVGSQGHGICVPVLSFSCLFLLGEGEDLMRVVREFIPVIIVSNIYLTPRWDR